MREYTYRGSSLSHRSFANPDGAIPVKRQETTYVCPRGHRTILPFAADVVAPRSWVCRCGATASLDDGSGTVAETGEKITRTPWDMLMERRTEDELKELLEKRLRMHREGYIPDYE